ncbi:MAG: helix-turn-helix transcriptional regulator [Tardiphaga sp.]
MAVMTKAANGDDIVILSRAEYETLVEQKEDRIDSDLLRASDARRAAGLEELLTSDEVDALLASPSPLTFWRTKRGMSEATLAEESGVSPAALVEIEAGKSTSDLNTLKKIAAALRITLDDLAA